MMMAMSLTQTPPATEPGVAERSRTKPNQKLESTSVSEQAIKNPPITTDARNQ